MDFGIKIQREDAVYWETAENAPIVQLLALAERQFAYATRLDGNGTVGVYDSGHILWRIKVSFFFCVTEFLILSFLFIIKNCIEILPIVETQSNRLASV